MRDFLAHALMRNRNRDDPQTTNRRHEIISEKRFLRAIYEEWYSLILAHVPNLNESVVELGSGAGFLKDFLPGLITSEIFLCKDIRVVLDGTKLPFARGSLGAIVMTDVLHHIPDCGAF